MPKILVVPFFQTRCIYATDFGTILLFSALVPVCMDITIDPDVPRHVHVVLLVIISLAYTAVEY